MPFCPKCRFEYRPGLTQCPDCGNALVAALPAEPEASRGPQPVYGEGEEFEEVLLCLADDGVQAILLRDALAKEGIPMRAQVGSRDQFDSLHSQGHWPFRSVTSGPVQIWVNKRDLANAREVARGFGVKA